MVTLVAAAAAGMADATWGTRATAPTSAVSGALFGVASKGPCCVFCPAVSIVFVPSTGRCPLPEPPPATSGVVAVIVDAVVAGASVGTGGTDGASGVF